MLRIFNHGLLKQIANSLGFRQIILYFGLSTSAYIEYRIKSSTVTYIFLLFFIHNNHESLFVCKYKTYLWHYFLYVCITHHVWDSLWAIETLQGLWSTWIFIVLGPNEYVCIVIRCKCCTVCRCSGCDSNNIVLCVCVVDVIAITLYWV